MLLVRLDRLDDAKAQLEAATPRDTLTTLLLATVERDLGRLDLSTALFAEVWDESLPRAAGDAQAKADCLTALNGLLHNSRESGRPEEAEPLLLQGLEALPAEAAFFHLQLGKHDAEAGRAESSAAHLKRAAELDPARYGAEADAILSQSRARAVGCQ